MTLNSADLENRALLILFHQTGSQHTMNSLIEPLLGISKEGDAETLKKTFDYYQIKRALSKKSSLLTLQRVIFKIEQSVTLLCHDNSSLILKGK